MIYKNNYRKRKNRHRRISFWNYNSKKLEITQVSNTTEVSHYFNKLQCISVVENCITIRGKQLCITTWKSSHCVCARVYMPACVVMEDTQTIKLYHISTFLLIKMYSYIMYIYAEKKNSRKDTIWESWTVWRGKVFFLILYTIALLKFFTKSYIKRMFSAGLKFREKNFTLKKEKSRAQYISPNPLSSPSSWIKQLIGNVCNS